MVINPNLLIVSSYLRYEQILDIASVLIDKAGIEQEEILVLTNNSKSLESIKSKLKEQKLGKIAVLEFLDFCKEVFLLQSIGLFFCEWRRTVKLITKIIEETPYPDFPLYLQCSNFILKIKKFQKENKRDINLSDYSKLGSKLFNIDSQDFLKKYSFEDIEEILNHYEIKIKENKYVDEIELLFEVFEILKNETVIKKLRKRRKVVIFDNFQDIDEINFKILEKLTKIIDRIYLLGDPDEAIYVFKGNLYDSFKSFKECFPNANILKAEEKLTINPHILEAANSFLNSNREDKLFLKKLSSRYEEESYPKIKLTNYIDANEEAEAVAKNILNILKNGNTKKIAVIFRNWNLGRKINKSLRKLKISFFSHELKKILNKEYSQDFLAYLNIAFEKDEESLNEYLMRIINKPFRGIDKKNFEKQFDKDFSLFEILKKEKEDRLIQEFLKTIKEIQIIALDESKDLRNRFEEIFEKAEILNYFSKFDKSLVEDFNFLLDEAFESNPTSFKDFKLELEKFLSFNNNDVYLSTIHSCKNKHFDYCFLISLNEGILPNFQAEIQEEMKMKT